MKDQKRQSIKEQVGLFFDRSLSDDAQQNLMHRVNSDPVFRATYNREKNVRELLRNSVQRTAVSPDLIKSIKSRIKID